MTLTLSEKAEEILKRLWTNEERTEDTALKKQELEMELGLELGLEEAEGNPLDELLSEGLIEARSMGVELTSQGRETASNVVRRHRLAERLLTDVLDTDLSRIEEPACRFEHILREGVEENICILLGHPEVCPHGKPIPRGICCLKNQKKATRVVSPVSELDPGEGGKIAYLHTKRKGMIQKLMSLGILPGVQAKVIQRHPTYVLQVGLTQLAVDEDIAENIYILIKRENRKEI